jgi:exodeoxyribonuclease V alpha subunit
VSVPYGMTGVPARVVELLGRGVLSALDVELARSLSELAGEAREEVMLALALASNAVQRGHVCLDLRRLRAAPLLDAEGVAIPDVTLPPHDQWIGTLRSCPELIGDGSAWTPLVLDEVNRLYLQRYHRYQQQLARRLRARATSLVEVSAPVLRDGLARLFVDDDGLSEQKLAAVVAVSQRLAIVSGGPGTGKTTTVLKILALLQEQALATRNQPLRLALLAPTGKAARRLQESIHARLADLAVQQSVREALEVTPSTIHRALGFQPRTPTRFRHDADNPLAADVVLVDEASMVDLALMAKLAAAVRTDAHLVLLGDKDQLASVQAGAILGDMWGDTGGRAYSRAFLDRMAELTGQDVPRVAGSRGPGIQDALVQLTKSYRYQATSGIAALARAINRGDGDAAMAVLEGEGAMPYGEAAMLELHEQRPVTGALAASVEAGFGPMLRCNDPRSRLELMSRFRILCAHRRGALGVETLNVLVEEHLERAGLLSADTPFYDGRPILVTRNDYQLELFNGDVGVMCKVGDSCRAFFFGERGTLRSIHPGRLPPHETVFAMTVHKSQGSEFDRVAVLLPERSSPILTRELVYTAVSRARRSVDIHGSEQVLRQAVARRIERASGLRDALWYDHEP